MAFLCPSRLGKEKRKKKDRSTLLLGRITGSASIDTLVRVGLEKQHGLSPESRMVVLQDFRACAEREIDVDQGLEVYVLYEDNEWSYVITEDAREGYVPNSYLSPWKNFHKRPLTPPSQYDPASDLSDPDLDSSHQPETVQRFTPKSSDQTFDVRQFKKHPYGRYVVVFDFEAADENDVTVESREVVTVLNMEDPDWYWVTRGNGEEGFVPRSFMCPFPSDLNLNTIGVDAIGAPAPEYTESEASRRRRDVNTNTLVEFTVTQDYKAQSKADLNVVVGDEVFADLTNQEGDEWLWVYSSKSNKCGYIPRVNARPAKGRLPVHHRALTNPNVAVV
ncbi:SH3 domain-containing protein Dlish-like [Gigantopelta aegis]|uniref:SH3 domain-containing protein Dlish-like n=1 Tax=Gigantopelta aegis TaxID=1735272 RepID=UPI001B88839D|nr:SH3 domain-containing protein Dlish-like [Gigantopelta aegis]